MFALLAAFIAWFLDLIFGTATLVVTPAPVYPLIRAASASQARLDRHLTRPPLVWAAP